ncbi:putative NAD(P)-binding protein [Glaciihabitans tibetensis]|uniref:Putative NAD(P)-binding protein n=1 Tax=Glaciihabitans tibetensis TaxID=1266600 RepID=A0A2T0V6X6_9MICO|nr:SDR family oxidoreductase [Glaciihabitans tibetensis]PRY65930.1 putative NAD(P)-binding protein [Glaciihabitans tibetensis]
MKIVIAGGHGKIALILENLLSEAGHTPIGIIRNPAHAADVLGAGASPLLLDLESTDAATLADSLSEVDAVVFAAGGGPNSGPDRKLTVDRDAAILLADAAEIAGVRRIVIVSAMATDDYDADSDDGFQIYLKAKSEADAAIRSRDLDWTIVRPGGLTDDAGTGLVQVSESIGHGSIPRADVAALIAAILVDNLAVRKQFEVISGEKSASEALADL